MEVNGNIGTPSGSSIIIEIVWWVQRGGRFVLLMSSPRGKDQESRFPTREAAG